MEDSKIWKYEPYKSNPPSSNCNWVVHNVLVGAHPDNDTLTKLLLFGCKVFINLCDHSFEYIDKLPNDVIYINLPSSVGNFPNYEDAKDVIEKILEWRKDYVVYIHCFGGIGRAGMLASIVYGKVYNVGVCEAIESVDCSRRENRRNKEYLHVPLPETSKQVNFVALFLDKEKDRDLPKRSATNWWE